MKNCPRCGTVKPLTDYYRNSSTADGLQNHCKKCKEDGRRTRKAIRRTPQWKSENAERIAVDREKKRKYFREYRQKNKEQMLKMEAAYREQNKDVLNARGNEWRAKNPERQKEFGAKYRASHVAESKARGKKWRQENPEKQRATETAWRLSNKDRLAAKASARRAAKLMATPSWAREEDILPFYNEARRLTETSGEQYHVDHIVPLCSYWVCGLHCSDNLQIIKQAENLSKNNMRWPDMGDLEFEKHPRRRR